MIEYNISDHNNEFINSYSDPVVMGNYLLDNNMTNDNIIETINIDQKYKYRPDRIAYEYYGDDSLFPLILSANNLRSLLDFDPEKLGNTIKVIKLDEVLRIQQTISQTIK